VLYLPAVPAAVARRLTVVVVVCGDPGEVRGGGRGLQVGGQLFRVHQVGPGTGPVRTDVGVIDERRVVRVVVLVVLELGGRPVVAPVAHALLVGLPAHAPGLKLVAEVAVWVLDVGPVDSAPGVRVAARDGQVVLVARVIHRVIVGQRGARRHQLV